MKKKNFEKPMIKFLKLEQTGVICASEGPDPENTISGQNIEAYQVKSTQTWFQN